MVSCAVEGCGGAISARGWCTYHYKRWHLYGDPVNRCIYCGEPVARRLRTCEAHRSEWLRNPDEIVRRVREYRAADRRKDRARQAVARALKRGQLFRPACCSACGRSDKPIEAHHPDYDKPLEVEWLCRSCHRRTDLLQHPDWYANRELSRQANIVRRQKEGFVSHAAPRSG